MKKLALNKEAVDTLKNLAQTLDVATENIVKAYDELNEFFIANTKSYGVHSDAFDEMIKKAVEAAEIATEALTEEVRNKLEEVANKIEAYIAAVPFVGMSAPTGVKVTNDINQLSFAVSEDGNRAALGGVDFVLMERNDGGREFVYDTPTAKEFMTFEKNKSEYSLLNPPDEFGERAGQGYVTVDPKTINAVLATEAAVTNNSLGEIWNHLEPIGDTGKYSSEAFPDRLKPEESQEVLRVDCIVSGYDKFYCLHENIGFRELYGFVKAGKEIDVEVVNIFKAPISLR